MPKFRAHESRWADPALLIQINDRGAVCQDASVGEQSLVHREQSLIHEST